MEQDKNNSWCNNWFNSPWYHRLYNKRDNLEAKHFITFLLKYLDLPAHSKVLDLACGKGRHSIVLNQLGYDVTGVDLADESIAEAKKQENATLKFFVHDMREVFRENYFDAVVNLFTSFGYMTKDEDNKAVIDAVYADLKTDGIFVLDFLNAEKVKQAVAQTPGGMMETEGATINWSKKIVNNAVKKEIVVSEQGKAHHFHEVVKLYSENELRRFLGDRFSVLNVFGNYSLDAFEVNSSDRLIIIAKKK